MKQKPPRGLGFLIVTTALVIAGGMGVASQWRRTMTLRTELELARQAAADLERLRAENTRLRERQISPEKLAALRADHAALPRLRAELEALQRRQAMGAP